MTLEASRHLGAFEVLGPLGAGGMGEVYRARDTKLGREVAVKVLPSEFAQATERLARFRREAQLLASLNHPNIAAIYGLEEADGITFLVLELVEGEDLAARLTRGPIPMEDALQIASQIADALEGAHKQGIVHRDLKPANVKQTPEGKVKILDFGLAKAYAGDVSQEVASDPSHSPTLALTGTRPGVILGTAAYMAPEQAAGKRVDQQADVWAFGVVVFEMLTGRRLFSATTASETLASVMKDEPDWTRLPADTPAPLRRLLRRCLQKTPSQRLQHIGDARLEINDAFSGVADEAEGGPVAVPPPAWRRRLRAGLTLLLLLVSVVLGYLWVSHVPPDVRVMRFEIPAAEGTTFNLDPEIPGPAVVSPDGRMLAFSARDVEGEVRLHVRPVDTTETRMLAGTDGAFYPFWSPDSQFIGFFAHGKLKKVEATGGPPLSLCDAPSGRGGSWSSEGAIVFAPGSSTPLHRVSDAGGESTPITQLDSESKVNSHRHPRFLPDGRRLLYLAKSSVAASDGHAVRVGSLDGKEEKLLLHSFAQADFASGHLLFLRGRTLMARPFDPGRLEFKGEEVRVAERVTVDGDANHAVFSASENGVLAYHAAGSRAGSKLEWFDREGDSAGSLGDAAEYVEVHLSPDGAHAAVSVSAGAGLDVWVHEIGRDIRTRFTFDATSWLPAWTPDGSELVFTSKRKGRYGLYRKSLGGPAEENLLIESEAIKFPESFSPDGKLLAFDHQVQDTAYDIWILPMDDEREPYPFVQTPFEEAGGAFSPDGRWMAYQSIESGRWEVYVTPFPGPGRKWQISTEGGAWVRWRGDGKEIFYHGLNRRLMAVEVGTQDGTFVVGAAKPLFEIGKLGHFFIYAATRDGQRFLVVRPEEVERSVPLTLVINWTTELKRS